MSDQERITALEQKVESLETTLQGILDKLGSGLSWKEIAEGINLTSNGRQERKRILEKQLQLLSEKSQEVSDPIDGPSRLVAFSQAIAMMATTIDAMERD